MLEFTAPSGIQQIVVEGHVQENRRSQSWTANEQLPVLLEWNNTYSNYPAHACVHQLFEAQVTRTPDMVAVVCEEGTLTYLELNQRANQVAHYLQDRGVGPEVLVGLCMHRSLDMLVGLLGILKAGGAYVPLDPAYPSERLAYMLQASGALLLLTQHVLVDHLPQQRAATICLDTERGSINQQDTHNIEGTADGENCIYVIYTSGSTGHPKGVQILHTSVVNLLLAMVQELEVTEQDVFLAITTLSFDIAVPEIFLPLITGARLLLESKEIAADPARLVERIQTLQPTLLQATPATWGMLLDAGLATLERQRIICTGEALPQELCRKLLAKRPQALWNLYGPTETTVWSTACKINSMSTSTSIGRPIANTQIYILDQQMQPVPIGMVGELYIGGAGLARGYLNLPAVTAEKFVSHPFSSVPGAKLYRTGDLARYYLDGTIECLGRIDHQIKIRGFRIELEEIETVLKQLPEVHNAVVIAREDTPGDKRLVAYLIASHGQRPATSHLRAALQATLPEYMLPSAFILLDTLPLTPNGKIDRRALPAPDLTRSVSRENFVAPTQVIHYQLLSIWEELLNIRPIGIKDNFFLLGGHSLLAANLITRIEQVFHKRIPLSILLAGSTIAYLAAELQKQREVETKPLLTTIRGNGSKRPFFFFHGDYSNGGFYSHSLAQQLEPDQPMYALEPYTHVGSEPPPSLEAIVDERLKLIRAIQPYGPYRLGGFCNGGLMAYELARQLHTQGETTDLLVLIDPSPVGYLQKFYLAIKFIGQMLHLGPKKQFYCFLWRFHLYRYLLHLYRFLRSPYYRQLQTGLSPAQVKQGGGMLLTIKTLYDLSLIHDIDRVQDAKCRPGKRCFTFRTFGAIFPETLFPPFETLHHDWENIFNWITANYNPDFYPGKNTFFFTQEAEERKEDIIWREMVKSEDEGPEIYFIPGTHITCKTIYLSDLSALLKKCLEKCQESDITA